MTSTFTINALDEAKCKTLSARLNILLANYQLFYMNLRGYHWNIRGIMFFELHAKFEELYSDVQVKIDEVAERILMLGQTPVHSYTAYIQTSEVKENLNVSKGDDAVENILKSLGIIIPLQREILGLADDANDEGTVAMMSDYIRQQEKLVWMLSAYLNKG